jgi:hypothetical protein
VGKFYHLSTKGGAEMKYCLRFSLPVVFVTVLITLGIIANAYAKRPSVPVTVVNTPIEIIDITNGNGGTEEIEMVSGFWWTALPTDPTSINILWTTVPEGKKLVVTDLFFQRSGGPAGTSFSVAMLEGGVQKFEYGFTMDTMLNSFEFHLKSGIVFGTGAEVFFSVELSGDMAPPMPPMNGESVRIFVSGYLTNQ